MHTCSITLPANLANALRIAAAKDKSRPYLEGFCVDFDGGNLVATDGHRLLAVPFAECSSFAVDEGHSFGKIIIPTLPRKVPVGGSILIHLEHGAQGMKIFANIITKHGKSKERLSLDPIDGPFPDCARVLPDARDWSVKRPASEIPSFNPKYLADVGAEIGDKHQVATIWPNEAHPVGGSMDVRYSGMPDGIRYIVMPCRA